MNESPLAKHRREIMRLTLAELSARCGLSVSSLSCAERGILAPFASRRRRYADAYELSVVEFERLMAKGGADGDGDDPVPEVRADDPR